MLLRNAYNAKLKKKHGFNMCFTRKGDVSVFNIASTKHGPEHVTTNMQFKANMGAC